MYKAKAQGDQRLEASPTFRSRKERREETEQSKLEKEVRKQLIDEIIKKHKMAKKPTDEEKLKRRKKYEEKQRELRRKRRRKVLSTKIKRKKLPQVAACPDCGEFHFKRSDTCKVRELKVKMIVQQIMKSSENIKVRNEILLKM